MDDRESFWKFINEDSLTDYSLIVASVSVGNVAQLACDLIISSLNMKKIASVYSEALIPVVGYDPYDLMSDIPSTTCEIYKSDVQKVIVMQLRAPLINEFAREFLQDTVKVFKEKNIGEVIILTSSFAHERRHISTSLFRYLANDLSVRRDQAKYLNWQEHETTGGQMQIFGGGFALMLYDICKENSMPCLVLYKYCSEGDNIPDVYDMINYLNGLLPLFDQTRDLLSQLIHPVSWKLFFGGPPPQEIY